MEDCGFCIPEQFKPGSNDSNWKSYPGESDYIGCRLLARWYVNVLSFERFSRTKKTIFLKFLSSKSPKNQESEEKSLKWKTKATLALIATISQTKRITQALKRSLLEPKNSFSIFRRVLNKLNRHPALSNGHFENLK